MKLSIPNEIENYTRQAEFIEDVGTIIDHAEALVKRYIEDFQYDRAINPHNHYVDCCFLDSLIHKFKRYYLSGDHK